MAFDKVNLQEKLASFDEHWQPKIVAEMNGQKVMVAKLEGAFDWHHHEQEDEMFLVIQGVLDLEFRDRTVTLQPGEFLVVPRRTEHRPVAREEVHVLMFEPVSTLNTGNLRNERTVAEPEKI